VSRERRYYFLQRIGCIACLMDGQPGEPADMHHIVDKGYRRLSGGDKATIPLCPWHHRGLPPSGFSEASARESFGPSLALHKRGFVARYGTERELLARVDVRLAKLEAA
jgi:hypothetical protein